MKDIDKLNLFIEIIVGFLTIAGAVYGGLVVVSKFLNKRRDTRKEFLEELDAMYGLFKEGENFVYIYNHEAKKVALIQNLDARVKAIQRFHTLNDDLDALAMFDGPCQALLTKWNTALNTNWQQWCDSAKGSAYNNGNPNWDAFSMPMFYDVYESTRRNLNVLRKQVKDSIS